MSVPPKSLARRGLNGVVLGLLVLAVVAGLRVWPGLGRPSKDMAVRPLLGGLKRVAFQQRRDPLEGGVAWLNTGGPITLKELHGKIVILDFWTYCCINCHHVLPVLAKIEEKYKNEVVVIGVHTPKFTAEGDTNNIRAKVHEYGIKHPVINDRDQTIWQRFGVESWPTIVVIGPDGKPLAKQGGEVPFEALDEFISKTIRDHKADINETPVQFFPENEKPDNTSLLYPGKVLADAASSRLFVSDTGHNRLVISDLFGKSPIVVGNGQAAMVDGTFEKASFHRPQGLSLLGDTLYVADTENHAIRAVDLKARTVTTVAGKGRQATYEEIAESQGMQPGLDSALSSPWDLAHVPGSSLLYVAMAGPHQIWKFDAKTNTIGRFAGTGRENIMDGPVASALFAQPSGLATDGTTLYVADSEVSALRAITLDAKRQAVHTIVGEGLFEFGDADGVGSAVRLQHCLGVALADGHLYVADTYNNKIKVCDPKTRSVRTFAGTGKPGGKDGPDESAQFYQPGGLSVADGKLYVADTNSQKIRVIDLATKVVSSLPIEVSPPTPPARKPHFLAVTAVQAEKIEAAPGKELTFDVTFPVPDGYKVNAEGVINYLVETPGKTGVIDFPASGAKLEPPSSRFSLKVPLSGAKDGETVDVKVSVMALICSEGSSLCRPKSYVWTIPVTFKAGADSTIAIK
jgi:DNA-binding beta-propeller fold protein YncE